MKIRMYIFNLRKIIKKKYENIIWEKEICIISIMKKYIIIIYI